MDREGEDARRETRSRLCLPSTETGGEARARRGLYPIPEQSGAGDMSATIKREPGELIHPARTTRPDGKTFFHDDHVQCVNCDEVFPIIMGEPKCNGVTLSACPWCSPKTTPRVRFYFEDQAFTSPRYAGQATEGTGEILILIDTDAPVDSYHVGTIPCGKRGTAEHKAAKREARDFVTWLNHRSAERSPL